MGRLRRKGAAVSEVRCLVCGAKSDAWLCHADTRTLEQHLAELPSLFAELTVTETRQGRTYRAGGRSEPDAEPKNDPYDVEPRLRSRDGRIALRAFALPFDEGASTLRDEAWATLVAWGRHLSESRGVTGPTDANLCVWLVAHVEAVRFDEAAAEMVDEVADVHRRLERAVDNSPTRTFWGRCDATTSDVVEMDGVVTIETGECGRDLYAKEGAETIVCDGWKGDGHGCTATRTTDDVRAALVGLLGQHLAPLEAIKAVLPRLDIELPRPGLWRSWLHRKQLQPKGKANGVALYSGADVLALVLDEGSRRGPKRGAA
jgi:hypothetical protein